MLDGAHVVEFEEGVQHFDLTREVRADFVDHQVHCTGICHEQFVPHLLHSRRRTGVKGINHWPQLVELLLDSQEFFAFVTVLTTGPFESQLLKVVFSRRIEAFHEALTERTSDLFLHDVRGKAFTRARRHQVDGVHVDRDYPTIMRLDRAPHLSGHHGEVEPYENPEEEVILRLGFLAENLDDALGCGVMLHLIQ
ncbi:hypothetical protein [Xanthomonas campestris]|uniref:hypothetical protein n=1 Tax=Xanthomonas campestris TaxID=339 RepID=UPI0040393049